MKIVVVILLVVWLLYSIALIKLNSGPKFNKPGMDVKEDCNHPHYPENLSSKRRKMISEQQIKEIVGSMPLPEVNILTKEGENFLMGYKMAKHDFLKRLKIK